MASKTYTCPDCGSSFEVEEGINSAVCPGCGITLKIPNNEIRNPKQFVTAQDLPLATAFVPGDYIPEAEYETRWQSEMVPHYYKLKACPEARGIYMSSFSKELYHDLKNPFLKGMVALLSCSTKNGYQKFMEPEDFLKKEAERISGIPLTAIAKAKLPSIYGNDPAAAQANLNEDIYKYSLFAGMTPKVLNTICESMLYRYKGTLIDRDVIVLAGMDYEGAELDYTPSGLDHISDAAGKAVDKLKDSFEKSFGRKMPSSGQIRETISDLASGKEKMTMKDLMNGGLIGRMMRDSRKENSGSIRQEAEKEEGPLPFGHGRHVDHIMSGAARTYYAMYYAEYDQEVLPVFMRFVSTIVEDPGLKQRETDMINRKLTAIAEEAARNQAIAQQKQMELQRNQARTAQILADNARSMSDGLMDSWNRKMASDARISQARSEATMGVNTYQNTYGQNVKVSVSADHVYQNQYGEVYGVSGNGIDQDILNQINWTELNKK